MLWFMSSWYTRVAVYGREGGRGKGDNKGVTLKKKTWHDVQPPFLFYYVVVLRDKVLSLGPQQDHNKHKQKKARVLL